MNFLFIVQNLKLLFFFLIIVIYNKKLFFDPLYSNNYFLKELKYYKHILNLKNKPLDKNNKLIRIEKKRIFKFISQTIKKNIYNINTLFYSCKCNFGNLLANLNKVLFYCEIIGCKFIILDETIFCL